MKLCVSTYSLNRADPAMSLNQKIDWIGQSEAKAIEFAVLQSHSEWKGSPQQVSALRRRCEKNGLEVASYCVGAELLQGPEAQKQVVEQVKREVDIAADLGCATMRHDVTRGWEQYADYEGKQTFGSAVRVIAPAIREIAEYAAEKGVKTSLENHGFYMQAAERIEKTLKAVDHENFGLTIDLGNFLCVNDDPVAAVERLGEYVVMAHAKDFHVKAKKDMPATGWIATPTRIAIRGAIVGHGEVDVAKQLKLLKRAGYDGYLSLEFEGMEPARMGVELGLSYLKDHLQKLGVLD